jgi:chaperonin GroEL
MSKTKIDFGTDARAQLQKGADVLANAVKTTLGAKGRNVAIDEGLGITRIVNDGVTVARSINHDDEVMNMGAYILKDAAAQTEDMAGDGTTTTVILGQSMIRQGMFHVSQGANPMDIKRGMAKAVNAMIKEIEGDAIPIKDSIPAIKSVATISANNDAEIGELIGRAVEKVGPHGVIISEESKSGETKIEVVDGAKIDRGYMSPWFSTNLDKKIAELEDPQILLTDHKITTIDMLVPLLENVDKSKPLLIIADDVDNDVVGLLVMNNTQGKTNCVCVKAPGVGESRMDSLLDLSVLTGARMISRAKNELLQDLNPKEDKDFFGGAANVVIDRDSTTFVDAYGATEDINELVDVLKKKAEEEQEDYELEKLQERIGRLTGGVASLHIGANTDVEMEEKKLRVDDALEATRSAINGGIVPGGGLELLRASSRVSDAIGDNEDEKIGVQIVLEAVKAPLFQLLKNAGVPLDPKLEKKRKISRFLFGLVGIKPSDSFYQEQQAKLIAKAIADNNYRLGYNVNTDEYVDMVEAGIIDPALVTISALSNSASAVSMLLTTEVVISKKSIIE